MNEKLQKLKGKIEEGEGKVTGNVRLKAKGKLEQTVANVRKTAKDKIS